MSSGSSKRDLGTHLQRQVTAADPERSVWVSANAGTGKTWVLINRILRLLLAGVEPTKVLCLTFTKAAAAEMANRLNERLGKWSVMAEPDLARDLEDLTLETPDAATLATARRLFAAALDTPGGLKIRTIHSFCESLLGRFPVEAGLAPHFSVVDERIAGELRTEARDRLMAGTGRANRELDGAFAALAGMVDEAGFQRVMNELDADRHHLAAMLDHWRGIDGVDAALRRHLDLAPDDTAEVLIAAGAGTDREGLLRAAAALADGSKTDQVRSDAIEGWLDGGRTPFADFRAQFVNKDGSAKAKLGTNAVEKADPGVIDILLDEQRRLLDLDDRLKALRTVEATRVLLTIGDALIGTYETLKRERALLDYDDLILNARDLLSDGRVAWVHYKLDGGIDHILVDEAQDTSPQQWDVVVALADEFFAGFGAGDEDRELDRTVFAVGDPKQSIYSFQGADPARFAAMRMFFRERAGGAREEWDEIELALSFRSVWTVLGTVDRVFEPEAARDGLGEPERPIRHLSSRDGQAGLIELWPPLVPDAVAEENPWDAPLDQMSAKSPAFHLAERIAATIGGWLDSGETLESAGRPIEAGDIMILVRTRGRFAEEMVRQLKQRRIPVAGSDRMVLTDQIAVMDLIAAGRFALLPDDDLNTAVVLKSPLGGLDDDDIFRLAHGRTGSLWASLLSKRGEERRFETAAGRLKAWLGRADFQPPFEFYSEILGADGGRRQLLSRLGPDADDPIDEFLNLALAFERDHAPSLEGFLHWVETGGTQIKRDLEHGGGEVRVMTVHGAKGLQSNIVFLPDTCSLPDTRLGARLYWTEIDTAPLVLWPAVKDNEGAVCRDLAVRKNADAAREYRRLLYVAMTRAKDRLYVCGWEGKRARPEGCWYDLIEAGVKESPGTEETHLADGTTVLRVRPPQDAPADQEGAERSGTAIETDVPEFAALPPMPEPAPPVPLAPSRPDGDEPPVQPPFDEGAENRFRRGRLIHRLLEFLPALDPSGREAAALRFLDQPSHGLSNDEQADIAAETLSVLADPRFAELFGPGSLAEVPLTGQVGSDDAGGVISAQIDRLVVTEEAVLIVDYKMNRPPPKTVDGVPEVYRRQMAAYAAALGSVFPEHRIRAFLLWTDGPSIMELPDEILSPYVA